MLDHGFVLFVDEGHEAGAGGVVLFLAEQFGLQGEELDLF